MQTIPINFTCKDIKDADREQFLHDYKTFFRVLYQDREGSITNNDRLKIAYKACTEAIYYLEQQYSKTFSITPSNDNGRLKLTVRYFTY